MKDLALREEGSILKIAWKPTPSVNSASQNTKQYFPCSASKTSPEEYAKRSTA